MDPALEQSTNVPTRTCTAIETLELNNTGDPVVHSYMCYLKKQAMGTTTNKMYLS